MAFFAPESYQNGIGLLGILTVGILHGANDLLIINRFAASKSKVDGLLYFSLYIAVIFLVGLFFYFASTFALGFFVLFSSYHFGEQHWEEKVSFSLKVLFYALYGLVVFFLLFTLQYDAVYPVIDQITGHTLSYLFFYGTLWALAPLLLILLFILQPLGVLIKEILLFAVLAFLFYKGSLLLAFAYYFVFWHSIPSLQSQVTYLYQSKKRGAFLSYIKKGAPYWILSLVGLIFFFTFTNLNASFLLPLFFVFLGAITFPHAVVMGYMFKDQRNTNKAA